MPQRGADQPGPAGKADAERFASSTARLLDDSHCEDVLVLDLRGLSPVTDFFVIATGTSDRQIQSVSEEVRALARHQGQGRPVTDSGDSSGWVVADFFDVVIHLFSPELRAYYDLESLWSDARRVDWRAVTKPGEFSHILRDRGVEVAG